MTVSESEKPAPSLYHDYNNDQSYINGDLATASIRYSNGYHCHKEDDADEDQLMNEEKNNNLKIDEEEDHSHQREVEKENIQLSSDSNFRTQIVWLNVILFVILHAMALYGVYTLLFEARFFTWLWVVFLHLFGGLGITAGAHRLFAHRSYKAKLPLRVLLTFQNCIAVQFAFTIFHSHGHYNEEPVHLFKKCCALRTRPGLTNGSVKSIRSIQNDVIEWARDHRVHHKFSETDADPHNARRGFFFAHMGWLMMKKHPDVSRRGRTVDMSDLLSDPVLQFQRRYYKQLALLCSVVIPTLVPWLVWGESLRVAYFCGAILRYCITLHATWTVNSLAHMYGYRPYDKHINPRENYISTVSTLGEGWHNYHHSFPFDYRASEFPWRINLSTIYIDLFAWLGWAYDRKTVTPEIIARKKLRTGD